MPHVDWNQYILESYLSRIEFLEQEIEMLEKENSFLRKEKNDYWDKVKQLIDLLISKK